MAVPGIATAANNTVPTAFGPLVDNTDYSGTRSEHGLQEWYYFGVGASQSVSVKVTNTTPSSVCAQHIDCFIRADLRNTKGELLVSGSDVSHVAPIMGIRAGNSATLTWTVPAAGTYTVDVFEGSAGDTYTLRVTGTPAIISDPAVVAPPVGPPPVDNGGVAPPPPPPSCKDLDTSLRKVEAASTKAGKASFSARKKYFAAKRVWLADPTSANKKKKNSALKTLRKYQKQVKTLKKQIVAGTALLTKSKCSCELSSRTLSKYNASLNKDRAALKKAKKAEKKAIGLPTFPKLHRATEKLQGKARLEKAKIKLIVAERTKNKCK